MEPYHAGADSLGCAKSFVSQDLLTTSCSYGRIGIQRTRPCLSASILQGSSLPLWVVSIRTSRSQPSRTGAWLSSPLLWCDPRSSGRCYPADGCPTRHSRSGCGAGLGLPSVDGQPVPLADQHHAGRPPAMIARRLPLGSVPSALFRSGSPPGMPGSGCPGRQRTARGCRRRCAQPAVVRFAQGYHVVQVRFSSALANRRRVYGLHAPPSSATTAASSAAAS